MTVSYGIGMPFCIVGTYIVSKYGLRLAISIGALLIFFGGLLCCLSTFPYLRDLMTPDAWYWMSLIGQALTAIGSPFIACLPTKISNHWFQEHQRIIATTILSLSNPVGIVLGQAVTPLFVEVSMEMSVVASCLRLCIVDPVIAPLLGNALTPHNFRLAGAQFFPNTKYVYIRSHLGRDRIEN